MASAFPRPWVRLLLDHPARIEAIVAAIPELAEARTKPDRFVVGPGVLARVVVGPLDPPTAAACLVGDSARVGAVLELSGGDPQDDTRRGRCAPEPIENQMARDLAEQGRMLTLDPADPNAGDADSPTLARVRAVMRIALRVAPHAIAVVVPEARTSYSPEEFLERSENNDDIRTIAGRRTLTTFEQEREGRWLQTRGHIVYGIPEVGLATTGFADPMDGADIVQVLAQDMQSWGTAPPHGATIEIAGETWVVSRGGAAVWLRSERERTDAAAAAASLHAEYEASFSTISKQQFGAMQIVQARTWNEGNAAPRHRVEVSVTPDGSRLMTTNGLGTRPRPGFTADEQGCIEIYTLVARDGPRIAHALGALAECAHATKAEQPFRFFDRIPLPTPIGDVAGLLLAPRFDMVVLEGHRVTWCMAVPIDADELTRIRSGASTGHQTIEEIERTQSWPRVLARWDALA